MPELLELYAATRDPLVFEAVDKALRGRAVAVASRLLRDRAHAEDVVQEALVRLEVLARQMHWHDFEGWWGTTLHNGVLNARRERKRRARQELVGGSAKHVRARERERATHDEVAWLREILETASLPWTVAVRLVIRGDSRGEVARSLGRPKGTVDRWCSEAVRWLRDRAASRGSRRTFEPKQTALSGVIYYRRDCPRDDSNHSSRDRVVPHMNESQADPQRVLSPPTGSLPQETATVEAVLAHASEYRKPDDI